MECYYPLHVWRGDVLESGKREILFKRPRVEGAGIVPTTLPCGRCIGCRLERSRQWAMRCLHEAAMHEENCFITLTYSDECMPKDGGLVKTEFPSFMKRLRQHLVRSGRDLNVNPIKYFHCGEYGEKLGRPHYHAILFGYDFADKLYFKKNRQGDRLYTSERLSALWSMGHALLGAVTFESAAYVARYVVEKIDVSEKSDEKTKQRWFDRYVDVETGTIRQEEFVTMSRRPGIGKKWYDKYMSDIYPRDYAILRGMKVRPPKYYDGLYELTNPAEFACMKRDRAKKAFAVDPTGFGENGESRLRVKEEFKRAQLRSLSRNLEV